MHLVWTLIIGGLAGFLAGKVMRGEGFGFIVDIIVGLIGGWIGSRLFLALGIFPAYGFVGSLLVAFIGAVILIWIIRLIKRA